MRLRSLFPWLVGFGGLAAAVSRFREAPPLPPALVGEQRTFRWRGVDVRYAEAGDPDDPDVVLLHGIHAAATSQEFDRIWDDLANDYHVLAPDLPGFGRSDRPPLMYTASTYRDFVADFADEYTEDATCIATSLSGAYAASVADDRFEELVLICPTDDTGSRRPWLRSLFRTSIVGELLFGALTVESSLRWWGAREGYEDPDALDDRTVDYMHRSARQPGARYAPASFIGGYLTPATNLRTMLEELSIPVRLIWGREATRPPVAIGRGYAAVTDSELQIVDNTRLLPHAERPDAFLEALRASPGLERLEAQ